MDTQIQWREVRSVTCIKRRTRNDGSVLDLKVTLNEIGNKTLEQRLADIEAQGYEILNVKYTTSQVTGG